MDEENNDQVHHEVKHHLTRKTIVLALVAVSVFMAVAGLINWFGEADKIEDNTQSEGLSAETVVATKEACEIFTDGIAVAALSDTAANTALPEGSTASTDDVTVSTCIYDTTELGLTATLLARSAKTVAGRDTNRFGFSSTKNLDLAGGDTSASEDLTGLGDQAYWNPDFGQVNVLAGDGDYWLIVQVGFNAETHDKELAVDLATRLVENL